MWNDIFFTWEGAFFYLQMFSSVKKTVSVELRKNAFLETDLVSVWCFWSLCLPNYSTHALIIIPFSWLIQWAKRWYLRFFFFVLGFLIKALNILHLKTMQKQKILTLLPRMWMACLHASAVCKAFSPSFSQVLLEFRKRYQKSCVFWKDCQSVLHNVLIKRGELSCLSG